MTRNSLVQSRQEPLRASYVINPQLALIRDVAAIKGKDLDDPFHTCVSINDDLQIPFKVGVHRAVGGLHDFPNPGDLLCASLAACFESTLRMISNLLGIRLKKTLVRATATVDVRGTLMMDKNVPVGFQSMELDIEIEVEHPADEASTTRLLGATEKSCIIYQTLKPSLPIRINKTISFSKTVSEIIP